ncbi:3'-5' exonuclease, partial [Klebsiella pneumoniae]
MLTYHQSVLKMMMANWLRSDYVIIDTETTGLKDFDEIIEITIINMRGEILLNSLVKPSRLIPPGVTEINNITNEMVADAPSW